MEMKSDWGQWSVHVLKELERLNENYTELSGKFDEMKERIFTTTQHARQISELVVEVENLKKFKVQAVTVWGVVQTVAVVLSYLLALK